MELGIISLSDIQTDPSTGKRATAAQRVDDAIGYATLADRTGLDVFALGEHHPRLRRRITCRRSRRRRHLAK